ncbi:MAG: pentapeptide repeat-containing protein [Candidatus Acidiferrales bacterium]
MVSVLQRLFRREAKGDTDAQDAKTAIADAPADESNSEAARAESAADEKPADEKASLEEFLLKNFLIEETPASEPAAEEPSVEFPRSEEATAEVPPAEIPPVVEAKADEPVHEEPLADELRTDASIGNEPKAVPSATELLASEAAPAVASPGPRRPAVITSEHAHVDTTEWALEEALGSHREWIESLGVAGKKADLVGAQLEGTELISVNLRYADLQDANLQAADLLLADLRDACLVRTNLQESCLVGANLEAANLEGATLDTAMGLVPRQLAGANLREAALPEQIAGFPALAQFTRSSVIASRYFKILLSASLISWLMIWKTKDVQLLMDSAILPFLRSSAAAEALPSAEIFLIVPVFLLILYLVFHYHLQQLWDSLLELPAVFPDGRALGENGPRIILGLSRAHFRWMNQDAASTRFIEKGVSILLAYWIVPATLLLFWARYLTLQEIHGTILQELLVVAATVVAIVSGTRVGRPQERWILHGSGKKNLFRRLKIVSPTYVTIGLLFAMAFLSFGTIWGVPHDRSRAPQLMAADIRRWAPSVFWSVGYDPFADLTEAAISPKPENWAGGDDQVSFVKGARLNNSNFRYAQAYGIFLVNAHLWRSDFQGAFMSQADLRNADLGQSNLRYAVLDRAQMQHANLDRSDLDGANLSVADFRLANLTYSSLVNAILVDARFDGASLYAAKLSGATMIRTSLEKADLREANLEYANLTHANLQQAYLWSAKLPGAHLDNAQLSGAIFIDAVLRGADLRGAQFNGTVLTGADIEGAYLDEADLRGALGISASQVCSAKSRRGVQLDETLRTQVEAQCGTSK